MILNQKMLPKTNVAGVAINFRSSKEFLISAVIIVKQGNTIITCQKNENLSRLNDLKSIIPSDIPIVVNISGKVVLNKTQHAGSKPTEAIPLPSSVDFYSFEYNDFSTSTLSFCRKDIVDELVNDLKKLGFPIVCLSLGPYVASALWRYKLVASNTLPIFENNLILEEQHILLDPETNQNGSCRAVTISDESFAESIVLPYSISFSYLLKGNLGNLINGEPEMLVKDFNFRLLYLHTRYYLLAGIFILLIINFFVLNSLNTKNNYLREQVELNTTIINKIDSLKSDLKTKEEFLMYANKNQTHYGMLLDQLALSVPPEVNLTQLIIFPLKDKIKKSEPVSTDKKIIISGFAQNSYIVNQWMQDIKQLEWTKEVNLVKYKFGEETKTGDFQLELEIR
jgi:Tfp pilus assembly protein PilN